MTKKNNDISLVMIVKNEEKGLEKAISSCRNFVDEVIISVDTESTDRTLEVAKKFADKVITYEWKSSFAAARNNVQKHVKTKWALHLDGHEHVKQWEKLNEMLKSENDTLFIKIIMENGFTFFYPRIVRKEIEWQHKVHNTPKSKKNTKYSEFIIIHDRTNYQAQEGAELRKEQREEMVIDELSGPAEKDKKNTRANFYLGNLYIDKKEWKKAIKYYNRVARYGKKPNQKWLARFHLGICYNQLGKHLFALWHFLKANEAQPNRWETAKMLGTTYAFIGWHKKALEHWVDSFKINTGEFMFCPIPRNDAQTWDFISLSFMMLGQTDQMKIACQQALREERENGPGLLPPQKVRILRTIVGQPDTQIDTSRIIEVCFLVYQRPERVPLILKQLKAQTKQNFRVNIWNNSSKKLDISNFPEDRIKIINSKENVGSQARFKLAKQTTGNPIIFFDDDQDLTDYFVEYNYRQYLKFGPKCILGWFTRTFDKEEYWKSLPAMYGEQVDYIATKAMILDREIIDKEPLLQNIPAPFVKVEDLYLCYLARMKHEMKMIKIDRYTWEKPDGKDQYPNINKQKAFLLLRKKGWRLLKDAPKTKTKKIKLKNYNKEIWIDLSIPDNWVMRPLAQSQVFYEEQMLEYIRRLNLDKNKSIVDCGANVGNHTLFFSLFCPHSIIFAFEPYNKVLKVLESHIEMNKLRTVIVYPYAIGAKAGFCDLEESPKNPKGKPMEGRTYTKQGNKIKVVTLDETLKGEKISLIKLDIEGDEFSALKGARKILQTQHPHLFVEVKPVYKIDKPSQELEINEFLRGLGYKRKARFNASPTYHYEYIGKLDLIKQGLKNLTTPIVETNKTVSSALKEQAYNNLIDFKKVIDATGIPFCLMDGTLLGAYRDGDFIKNDYNDVDVGIPEKYNDRVSEIVANLATKGFSKLKEFCFEGKSRGASVLRKGNHVDFFFIHIKGKEAYNLGRKFSPLNKKPYRAYVYPAHCFKKFDKLIFKGAEFNIPHKVEDYLEARYENWKKPCIRGEGYNWLDQKQNPALKFNYEI